MGLTLLYLSLIVLIPLSATFLKAATGGWAHFWQTVTEPRALASYRLSFGASLVGALVNAVMGLVVAWVLVRYRFPGQRVLDALVDLPFALPTAVALGIERGHVAPGDHVALLGIGSGLSSIMLGVKW